MLGHSGQIIVRLAFFQPGHQQQTIRWLRVGGPPETIGRDRPSMWLHCLPFEPALSVFAFINTEIPSVEAGEGQRGKEPAHWLRGHLDWPHSIIQRSDFGLTGNAVRWGNGVQMLKTLTSKDVTE